MEHLNFQPDPALAEDSFDNYNANTFFASNSPWPLHLDPATMSRNQTDSSTSEAANQHASIPTTSSLGIRTSMPAVTSMAPLQTAGFAFSQAMNPSAQQMLTAADLQYDLMSGQNYEADHAFNMNQHISFTGYPIPLHSSPTDLIPRSQEPLHNSIESTYLQSFNPMDNVNEVSYGQFNDFNSLLTSNFNMATGEYPSHSLPHSPQETFLSRSLSNQSVSNGSDGSWTFMEMPRSRQSLDAFSDSSNQVVSPQNLHVRTDSSSSQDSDAPPLSANSYGSFVEIFPPISPEPESHHDCNHNHSHSLSQSPMLSHGLPLSQDIDHFHSPMHQSLMPVTSQQLVLSNPSSASTSPNSSAATSPKAKRRNSPVSPVGITPKAIGKKKLTVTTSTAAKEKPAKKLGRRHGPLRPDQRQQAHEIRKLRACLRCKFLKKVCNKGDPCNGCQPAHARLWQVPCTRMSISEIGFFYKNWTADFERHVTCDMSITNIKGFGPTERILYISHGYNYNMPLPVREVYVVDEKSFGVDWKETFTESPIEFELMTARLSARHDGISRPVLSQYLDLHVDGGFERFIDEYYAGTKFTTELLKTIYRNYHRTKSPIIRKGLKLVIAYALTLHITLIEPVCDEDAAIEGKIEDQDSRWYGKIAAPVMINFQIKKAMADMWRDLMKEVLEDLSELLTSVYTGQKLKHWPTIFMLSSLVLAVWEMMQFDSHYRIPDKAYVNKFCNEMENIPMGVVVGLFGAISTKVPSFLEWDTRKHSHVLNNDQPACDTMTEVRAHIQKHGMSHYFSSQLHWILIYTIEAYLKGRSDAKFERDDFDSLSNKFLSKLVIRSN
jgi:hypothetical protein